ncbi:MAG: 50S ribosomal protein L4 [Campylobacteraceae bacterium]|jgi:large subunit ribosomal protein L4|nr:50S ribosomal protein L4 [Campylobacteraceae bacterium]
MSTANIKAIVLDETFKKTGDFDLPQEYAEINSHNLYLYTKSYLAALRAGTAHTKNKGSVSGGGKKPWSQKGRGGARAGSSRSSVWVGGGSAFGPRGNRNYDLKVNKKQKKLALAYALFEKAKIGALFIVDSLEIASGKAKDAAALVKTLNLRDALIVKDLVDEKTFLAFRNLNNSYLADAGELNAYMVAVFHAVVIEKSVLENIIKEG